MDKLERLRNYLQSIGYDVKIYDNDKIEVSPLNQEDKVFNAQLRYDKAWNKFVVYIPETSLEPTNYIEVTSNIQQLVNYAIDCNFILSNATTADDRMRHTNK